MKIPRFIHRVYAAVMGCFWLPCPLCGKMFGGHEWLPGNDLMQSFGRGQGVCPGCGDLARKMSIKQFPSNPECTRQPTSAAGNP